MSAVSLLTSRFVGGASGGARGDSLDDVARHRARARGVRDRCRRHVSRQRAARARAQGAALSRALRVRGAARAPGGGQAHDHLEGSGRRSACASSARTCRTAASSTRSPRRSESTSRPTSSATRSSGFCRICITANGRASCRTRSRACSSAPRSSWPSTSWSRRTSSRSASCCRTASRWRRWAARSSAPSQTSISSSDLEARTASLIDVFYQAFQPFHWTCCSPSPRACRRLGRAVPRT